MTLENKRRFRATIAGKDYTIVGNRSATHLNQVVELVNQQLGHLAELAPAMSVADRAILMSVNAISDQLVKEQKIAELEQRIVQLEQAVPSKHKQTSKPEIPFSRKGQA